MTTIGSSTLSSATIGDETNQTDKIQQYSDALHRYYQLKYRYENGISTKKASIKRTYKSNRERRDAFRRFIPACISCGRNVGSNFTCTSNNDETKHVAKCGDTKNSCQLDIELKSGTPIDIRAERASELEKMNQYGNNIIRLTNDGMFGYINGDKVVELLESYEQERIANDIIQKKRKALIENRDHVSEIERSYKNASLPDNREKQTEIRDSIDLLNEHIATIKSHMEQYTRTGNKQFIRDSITLYKDEMRNNLNYLNRLKYARMAVEITSMKPRIFTLYQEIATIQSWMLDDITPQVVKFSVGKRLETPEVRDSEEEFVPPAIPDIDSVKIDANDTINLADTEKIDVSESELTDIPIDKTEEVLSSTDSVTKADVDSDAESDAESDADSEDETTTLPRINIGDTVDTSSDDSFIPPPPPISDMELSISDEGFVPPPPPPIDEIEDTSSEGYVPAPSPPKEE